MISRPSRGRCALPALLLGLALGAPLAPASAAPPASAIPRGSAEPPAPQAADVPLLRSAASGEDYRLAGRIRAIFGEIAPLRQVRVRVAAGVVTLTGPVPTRPDGERAEAIAAKLQGVVTVENRLERDLAVEGNLSPALGNLKSRVASLGRGLPLLAIAIVAGVLIALLGHALAARRGLWRRVAPNLFLAELIATAVRVAFVVAGVVVALDILGATALLGAVLGGAGVLGIALGFAVRDTIDNYVSSLMLSVRQPFRANDNVAIDGQEGRVARLTSRATILVTPDGNQLRIPNSTVFKAVIVNFTRNPERRFTFDVPVDAACDPIAGLRVGGKALRAMDCVLPAPRARGIVAELDRSGTLLRFEGWIDQRQTDFGKARGRAIAAVKRALDDSGFSLAPPVQRIRIEDEVPAGSEWRGMPHDKGGNAEGDVSPEAHLETMVAKERSARLREDDLLDAGRPQE